MKEKKIVSAEEYQNAREKLLKEEAATTHLLPSLAASRRQLPMVYIRDPNGFKFDTVDGEKTLPDLYDGRK